MDGKSGNLICRGMEIEDVESERRLWLAVLAQALEDWQSDRVFTRQRAEHFLFEEGEDFDTVCAGAGLNASSFRVQLRKISAKRAPNPAASDAQPLLAA